MFLWCRWRSLANCSVFAICVVASFAWGGEAFGPPAFQEVQGGCQTWSLLHRRDREQNAMGGAAPGSVGERRVAGTLNQNNQKQAFWHHHVAWNTIILVSWSRWALLMQQLLCISAIYSRKDTVAFVSCADNDVLWLYDAMTNSQWWVMNIYIYTIYLYIT